MAIATRHTIATRLVHAGLALAVVTQLFSSLVMQPEEDGHAGNLAFEIHEYGGLAAFAFIVIFWFVLTARRRGTPVGMLFPWFSGTRLLALRDDTKRHLAALRRFRLPSHNGASPFASAVHGLGILLITAMAASGALYYVIGEGNPDAGGLVGVAMSIHKALANLAWAYLIGHASLALIQHHFTEFNLREMWSFRSASK
ncbi:cytochrome b561 [Salipiger thiooxidans]|uniref:Cytochrome b561 n=1 Tax=Salipiger thiooxidans TaxID=282683 RepID=A0A1G7FF18_9RHOB|nr:cytochrome b/b6 domain-containing protein [Salipiger thiooxidans]SDE74501.1 cytochrome b561 [Salipiger thiooxidans]